MPATILAILWAIFYVPAPNNPMFAAVLEQYNSAHGLQSVSAGHAHQIQTGLVKRRAR